MRKSKTSSSYISEDGRIFYREPVKDMAFYQPMPLQGVFNIGDKFCIRAYELRTKDVVILNGHKWSVTAVMPHNFILKGLYMHYTGNYHHNVGTFYIGRNSIQILEIYIDEIKYNY